MIKWLLLSLAILTACTKKDGPEASLEDFIKTRYNTVVTRQYLLDRTTGKLRTSMETISEEDFKKFADVRGGVNTDSFTIISKSCEKELCSVNYSLSYNTTEGEKSTFATVVEKKADMVRVDGKWLISEVNNINTSHEALEPINALE
jgi:hypothetical protein